MFASPSIEFGPGDDLPAIIARLALATPERIALGDATRSVTFRELALGVDGVAAMLASHRGRRAAVLSHNSIEYVEVCFGALRAGLCVVPLPTLASRDALASMIADSDPVVLFASAAYRETAQALAAGRELECVGLDFSGDGCSSYAEWLTRGKSFTPPPIAGSDAFDVFYSSGTTGVPKGIVHSHAARKASYAGSRARYFSAHTVNLVATPFYSNTTCVTWFLTTAAGGTNVILGKFSPDAFADAVERHRATHAMLVPVQYERLLESARNAFGEGSSLRYLFSTSAPLRAETKRRLLDQSSAELVEIYGLTEGGPVTVLEARQHPDKLASVGKPAPGSEVLVVDEAGRELPRGAAGEVVGRSANLMSGYLNRPEDTAQVMLQVDAGTPFFKTGDLGRFDEDGFLYLLDRKKDVIISGGFNVYATDLEAVLLEHPDVLEASVIGVPSERWGETPLGLVVLRPASEASAAAILEHCNARLGKIQRLSAIELRGELPKNAIGKVLKRELRAPYWKDRSA
jgi:long-chain acyl-CoA synthetase